VTNVYLPLVATGGDPSAAQVPNLGVGLAWQRGPAWAQQSLALLQPPLWKNWHWDTLDDPAYIPHVFSIQPSAGNQRAMNLAATMPGRLWEIGNEPELPGTAIAPATAAAFMRDWQATAGNNFAAPGIIVSDAGLAWLDAYLAAGGPVGDLWNVHLYYVTTGADWQRTWARWLKWQSVNGLKRPSLISETNAWPGGDQQSVLAAVVAALAADPLLYAALWYSDTDYWNRFHDPDLRTVAGTLTPLGQRYRNSLTGNAKAATHPPD
jgi:hypothetical protein